MNRFLLAATVALFAAPAFAQSVESRPTTVTLGAGVTVSTGDFAGTNALAGQVALSSRLTGPLAWRVEVGRDQFGICTACEDATIWRFSGGLELRYGDESGVEVYAIATAGAFVLGQGGTSEMRLGSSIGAGFNLAAGRNWGFGIDTHFNMRTSPSGSASDWWFSPTAQVYFKF